MSGASVLVTDGEQRAALATVRSLGRAGHRVVVTSAGHSLAGASRYAAEDLRVPDPLTEPRAFAQAIAEITADRATDVLLPIGEASLLAVLELDKRVGKCQLPFPSLAKVRAISDKARVLAAARDVGIATPEQFSLACAADAAALAPERSRFPLVLKPARSIGDEPRERRQLRVRHAADPRQLASELAALPSAAYPLLVQQRIVGPGVGIFLLLWEGQQVAVFSHRRLREKPPAGGVSVYRESIAADPSLVARSRALLDRFGWHGVAMVEYKLDAASGTPYLMEINGRFWGSLQLAIDAGVDFPALLVSLALGGHPRPVRRYRVGVRSRWWMGDVDHLVARIRHSATQLSLPPGSPSRLAALGGFLRLWQPGDRNEILRWNDPIPALREIIDWLRRR